MDRHLHSGEYLPVLGIRERTPLLVALLSGHEQRDPYPPAEADELGRNTHLTSSKKGLKNGPHSVRISRKLADSECSPLSFLLCVGDASTLDQRCWSAGEMRWRWLRTMLVYRYYPCSMKGNFQKKQSTSRQTYSIHLVREWLL